VKLSLVVIKNRDCQCQCDLLRPLGHNWAESWIAASWLGEKIRQIVALNGGFELVSSREATDSAY
jgi:hypothetical protein